MTMEKIAITVPKDVLRRARQAVKQGAAPSLSAYISGLLDTKTRRANLDALFAEMFAETGGPPTPDEIAEADRKLGLRPNGKKAQRPTPSAKAAKRRTA